MRRRYLNFTAGSKTTNIGAVLDTLVTDDKNLKHEVEGLKKKVKIIHQQSRKQIQKIGVVRFNPFGRTGSEQSFVLALLSEENSGIVINFIYTHEGVRVYTKIVKNGQGVERSLSEEESRAVEKSMLN